MKIENILIPALVRGGFGTFYYTLSQPSRICFLNPVQHVDNPHRYGATSSRDIIANADMAHDDTTTRRREGGREAEGKNVGHLLTIFRPEGRIRLPLSLSLSLSLSLLLFFHSRLSPRKRSGITI